MILVVGASGLLGTAICRQLRARDLPASALVRHGSSKEPRLRELGVAIVEGDLKDSRTLEAACRGANVVITTANAISSRRAGDSLGTVDLQGSLALLDAAKRAGVTHFIYTSLTPSLPANNRFVRYKRTVERAVRASGLQWTILQPAAFMEIHAGPALGWDFVNGRARIMGSGRTPICYISFNDVAALAVTSLSHSQAINRDLHVTGPEPLSAWEAIRIAEHVVGRAFKVQRIPLAVLRTVRFLVTPFNEILGSELGMGLGMELGERTDLVGRLTEFGVQPTTFAQYVRRACAAATKQ